MFRVVSFEVRNSSPPILTRTDPLQHDDFPPLNHGATLGMGIIRLGGRGGGFLLKGEDYLTSSFRRLSLSFPE